MHFYWSNVELSIDTTISTTSIVTNCPQHCCLGVYEGLKCRTANSGTWILNVLVMLDVPINTRKFCDWGTQRVWANAFGFEKYLPLIWFPAFAIAESQSPSAHAAERQPARGRVTMRALWPFRYPSYQCISMLTLRPFTTRWLLQLLHFTSFVTIIACDS